MSLSTLVVEMLHISATSRTDKASFRCVGTAVCGFVATMGGSEPPTMTDVKKLLGFYSESHDK